ncbi:acetate--CoA ligase [Thermaerobacter sp. PB12/4term]|uniref:acetate--CoA ligase n=1 Tax=Thermaerobacter sp. PB12/4term TaxID=2293838 RepID=UPI000E32B54E|nr:acetate--CoA ligase [Thermaerobacter sp. PB12/4term]QIA27388.1 acetate--CoA ligase [Thermaerobacter sp. PB12/4term]
MDGMPSAAAPAPGPGLNPLVRRRVEEGLADWEGFWAREARKLPWFRPWDRVFQPEPPSFRWFAGGLTNLAHNALDVHLERDWGGHAALIALNERGERRVYTYAQLWHQVRQVAAALRGLGVQRGDRVALYMPTIPEAICTMLACARIGAIHMVVFAGFGSAALAQRMQLAGARVLVTADVTWRKGREIDLWGLAVDALATPGCPVERVVVLPRSGRHLALTPGRDMTWDQFLSLAADGSPEVELMEANEPAFILATSGTTAQPKLVVHSQGAYQVGVYNAATMGFGLRPGDIWWSTSDIGWIVGHGYIVYAPLLVGCTTIAYEGALDHPGPETFYRILEENRVTGIFTAPTAVRMLMAYGTEPARRFDLSSVERVFCAGEVLNPPAWDWLQNRVFGGRVPVIDHWWQTETGAPVTGNPYGISLLPIKPGSGGIALPGREVEVRTPEGEPCGPGEKGVLVITRPFPGLTAELWGDPERYASDYWGRIPGVYFTGDAAAMDEDGYVWFSGRSDELIKIAGHRIGTIEVETAFLRHPAVAEAGVTARPDPVRGEVIVAFIVLKKGHEPSAALREELIATVRHHLGPVAVIGDLHFVPLLPKTRSGKIMRRVLEAVVLDRDPGDISTIEDEGAVEQARQAWQAMRASLESDAAGT